jgi:hypothetical protein
MMALAVALLAAAGSPELVHVGPGQDVGTLAEALQLAAARGAASTGPFTTIRLHGVAAVPSSELVLGAEHSHLHIVGGTVSGGVRIGGAGAAWKKTAGNIWTAKTPAGLPPARQLYVDGARANRTMTWWPAKAKFSVVGSSLVSSDSTAATVLLKLAPSEPASMLEAVFTGGGKEHAPHAAPGQSSYREARCPVVSIRALQGPGLEALSTLSRGVNLTLAEPCYSRARALSSCTTPSYISNSRQQLLDGGAPPGSFFFDSSSRELLWVAPAGWQPSESEVILPVNQTLVRVKEGAMGVSFRGVTFEYAGWLGPNEPAGYVDDQAGTQVVDDAAHCMLPGKPCVLPNRTIPANVVVEGGARGVVFDNCTFRHLGGTALHFQAGAQHSSVKRAEFYDVDISVSDSVVSDLPREYHGAVAIVVFIAAQASILHNEISGCSYTAVSVGWGWDSTMGNNSYARENRVIGNHFHDTMQLLFDGGDIYTLGAAPGSVAAYNHIHGHKGCTKTNGLYHDQGTTGWTDFQNVVQLGVGPHPCRSSGRDAAAWAIMWIDSIHNCHLFSNYADTNHSVNWDRTNEDCSINSTTVFTPGGPIPAAARAIMDAAGPRTGHRDEYFWAAGGERAAAIPAAGTIKC